VSAPLHLSHSQIDTIFSCGEKYRLQKVCNAPQKPAWYFVAGSAFHQATEAYDRGYYAADRDLEKNIVYLWEEEFAKERDLARVEEPDESLWGMGGRAPNKEGAAFFEKNGPTWVANYRKWRHEHPELQVLELNDGSQAIETSYTVSIAGRLVKGALDRVFVDTNTGTPLLVDLKAGKKPQSNIQLGEYAVALNLLLDLTVDYGAYYLAREGRLTEPVPLNTFTLKNYEDMVTGAELLRSNKIFVARPSSFCSSCSVNRFCATYGGADAATYEGVTE
jgi:putative RecB family exonuclease